MTKAVSTYIESLSRRDLDFSKLPEDFMTECLEVIRKRGPAIRDSIAVSGEGRQRELHPWLSIIDVIHPEAEI